MLFIVFVLFPLAAFAFNPDPGRPCKAGEKGKPGIKFYLDTDRQRIYPFKHLGCGDSKQVDTFDSYSEAGQLLLIDNVECWGFAPTDGSCDDGHGPRIIAPQGISTPAPKVCKKGYRCQNFGISGGLCCSEKADEEYTKSRKQPCPKGTKPLPDNFGNRFEDLLVGRSCKHNFCPNGSKCVDTKFEAYCCK